MDTRYGLIIDNITEEDNGQYKCQGEVTSRGSVKFVLINVEVYSKYLQTYFTRLPVGKSLSRLYLRNRKV